MGSSGGSIGRKRNGSRMCTGITSLWVLRAATAGLIVAIVGCPSPPSSPRTRHVQIGPILVGGDLPWEVTVEVPFENDRQTVLDIARVTTSCGCLSASMATGPLRPGERRPIQLRYVAVRPTATNVEEAWVITRNAGVWRFVVTATALPRLEVTPRFLRLGYVPTGESTSAEILLKARTRPDEAEPIRLVSMVAVRGSVQLEAAPWARERGGPFEAWSRSIRVTLPLADATGAGSDIVKLTFDRPVRLSYHEEPSAVVDVPVSWYRIPPVRLTPELLVLEPGESAVVRVAKTTTGHVELSGIRFDPPIDGLRAELPNERTIPCEIRLTYDPPVLSAETATSTLVVSVDGGRPMHARARILLRSASGAIQGASQVTQGAGHESR